MKFRPFLFFVLIAFCACSPSKRIARSAQADVLNDPALKAAHVGISIYEPGSGKYWYDYQGDKYFVPASNTKLPACYAAMKYLGDSLVGLRYQVFSNKSFNVFPTADPSFLQEDFKRQPVLDFLRTPGYEFFMSTAGWKEDALGSGWSWNDYTDTYMAERSAFPIYGNVVSLKLDTFNYQPAAMNLQWSATPAYFSSFPPRRYTWPANQGHKDSATMKKGLLSFTIRRKMESNEFLLEPSGAPFRNLETTFFTDRSQTAADILRKDFGIKINAGILNEESLYGDLKRQLEVHKIYSQPTDSLLKPMMHRSDNFFAEQSLLMVSNERLGFMNDAAIIDTLLKTDLKDLPQRPRWVDGSGLSRYNLFTPQDLVAILDKMRTEFGMERIKGILPTGNKGTLSNYYKKEQGFLFAKTGTLSGVVALSGFLYTKKNKLLIFSILVNNHQGSATQVRRAVEKFIEQLREKL